MQLSPCCRYMAKPRAVIPIYPSLLWRPIRGKTNRTVNSSHQSLLGSWVALAHTVRKRSRAELARAKGTCKIHIPSIK